jgi:hypothetical protein
MQRPSIPSAPETLHLGGGRHYFARWSSSDAQRASEWTIAQLARLGIPTGGQNRLNEAATIIRQTNLVQVQYDYNSDTARAVAEALKTTFEQYLIVKDLNEVDAPARKKLRLMLRGTLTPSTRDDQGRDVQAELFAGVVFRAAGYRVDLAEPDLVISRAGGKWGVAVKRVKNERQFTTRLRGAQEQLQRHRLYGFVVVNPELLLDAMLAGSLLSHDDVSASLYGRIAALANLVDDSRPSNRVLAVMALATAFAPVQRSEGFRFEFGVFIHQVYLTAKNPKWVAAIKRVGEAMYSGINRGLRAGAIPPVDAAQ